MDGFMEIQFKSFDRDCTFLGTFSYHVSLLFLSHGKCSNCLLLCNNMKGICKSKDQRPNVPQKAASAPHTRLHLM